jgi:hypothetical protein
MSQTDAALLRVYIAQAVFKIGNELLEAFSRGQVGNLLQQPARLLKLLLKVGSGFVAITHHATPVFIGRWSGENVQFLLALRRCPEFAGKPPCGSRLHGVARNDFVLYGAALRTFEQAMLKAGWTRTDARQHHARRAVRTARALDACE